MKGGREARDVSAVELAKAVEELGAGEILLNCIDNDGQGNVHPTLPLPLHTFPRDLTWSSQMPSAKL